MNPGYMIYYCSTEEEYLEAVKKAKPYDTIIYDESDKTTGKSLLALKIYEEWKSKH